MYSLAEVSVLREVIEQWRHVFKLDPEREITDDALEQLCMSGTDAIMVGGSSGVTFDNTVDLLSRIRRYTLPCILEVSNQDAIVPGFDLFFIPMVMNTDDARWVTGFHHQAVKEWGARLPWQEVITEGYVVLNPDSTVADVTAARTRLDLRDITAYARMAEHLFQFPIFYMEYSGMFGDMNAVKETAKVLNRTRLFYGGGIDSLARAQEAAQAAHTIVVGNIIYENLQKALETVQVKDANMLK
jgi:putative glycerol-1-phosphate prenyltransferase